MRIFASGDCPIDGFLGPLYFAKVPRSGEIFFACTMCGVAWRKPPALNTVDIIDPISDYTPKGFLLPTKEDIIQAALDKHIVTEKDLEPEAVDHEFRGYLFQGKE